MTESVFTQETRSEFGPSDLQAIAEKSATSILLKIKEREKSILAAQNAAKNAANMKTGLWRIGNTDKKVDATANALLQTNTALAEMNDLIQESIKFTCTSVQFAQVMHKTMAYLMASGFKDANGSIQTLASESKEFVELILNEADDFVRKQLSFEEGHAALKARLDHKDQVDAEQSLRLEQLQVLLDHKTAVDDKQEQAIRLLLDYTKQKDQLDKEKSEIIQKLIKQVQAGKLSLTISILSLIVSFAVFALIYLQSKGAA